MFSIYAAFSVKTYRVFFTCFCSLKPFNVWLRWRKIWKLLSILVICLGSDDNICGWLYAYDCYINEMFSQYKIIMRICLAGCKLKYNELFSNQIITVYRKLNQILYNFVYITDVFTCIKMKIRLNSTITKIALTSQILVACHKNQFKLYGMEKTVYPDVTLKNDCTFLSQFY